MNVEVRYSTCREPQGRTIIFIDIKSQSDTRRRCLRCASDATLRNSLFDIRYSLQEFYKKLFLERDDAFYGRRNTYITRIYVSH